MHAIVYYESRLGLLHKNAFLPCKYGMRMQCVQLVRSFSEGGHAFNYSIE